MAYSEKFSNSRLTFHTVKMFGYSDTVRSFLLTVTLFQCPRTVPVSGYTGYEYGCTVQRGASIRKVSKIIISGVPPACLGSK